MFFARMFLVNIHSPWHCVSAAENKNKASYRIVQSNPYYSSMMCFEIRITSGKVLDVNGPVPNVVEW